MGTFVAKDGQFWLNGQPVFIHAGEFHYFRTPVAQWEHSLNLLRQAGLNTLAAYIPWLWHQPQVGVTDLDGHTHPLRDLAGFLDLAADMGFWLIPRPGPYIMAETINEGVPPWVFSQHPDAAFIDQTGTRQNIVSYLHPDFLRCVDSWYEAVFGVLAPRQVTRGGKILMVQLDNEMGMIHWVRNIVDTNPDTLARFAAWLQATYGAGLAARYPAGDLAGFLRAQISTPTGEYGARMLEDYRHFFRGYLREYTGQLWSRARAHGLEVPPVINVHGFTNTMGGRSFPIGLSQLTDAMALDGMISATDVYPIYIGEGNYTQIVLLNAMTRALHNPQQPLFSIEFQSGGYQDHGSAQSSMYDLHSRLSIACGMRAINHYLFFAGENDPVLSPVKRHDWGPPVRVDGTVRRHYHRYGKLSATLTAYGTALVTALPKTVASIGFQIDDFMTEVGNVATRPADDVLVHQRNDILFDFIGRGLSLTHRPYDALELARQPLDAAHTPVLFTMLDKRCDASVQHKLVEYVRAGGRLVIAGRMPDAERNGAPCAVLRDAVGVQIARTDPPFTQAHLRVFDQTDVPVSFLETYRGDFDEVLASTANGETVGFLQRVGAGQVLMFGAAMTADVPEDLHIFDQMAARIGCQPLFVMDEWADVHLSEGDEGSFLFVNNYQDDPIASAISKEGTALLGGHPVALPARRGVILPLDWQVRPGVLVHYCTAEINGVVEDGADLTLKTDPLACYAEISLTGYRPVDALGAHEVGAGRFRMHVQDGIIALKRV
ncbi:MAG: beta-galactosidase [Pleurocapsa minor GSE-CHR-MK-17-07R]|jgi:beta-galactosidase|nr:beta-galactosidase [Pleurocapsa minor GSE-CHR-MK 17-07R]